MWVLLMLMMLDWEVGEHSSGSCSLAFSTCVGLQLPTFGGMRSRGWRLGGTVKSGASQVSAGGHTQVREAVQLLFPRPGEIFWWSWGPRAVGRAASWRARAGNSALPGFGGWQGEGKRWQTGAFSSEVIHLPLGAVVPSLS